VNLEDMLRNIQADSHNRGNGRHVDLSSLRDRRRTTPQMWHNHWP
jgi:hypothetical protein